jgi:hypothetical protein
MIQEVQKDPFLSSDFKVRVNTLWEKLPNVDRKTGKEEIKSLVSDMSQSTALTPLFTRRLECDMNRRLKKENEIL